MTMRIGPFCFQPGLAATLAAVPFLALLVWLGLWQADRAAEKRARQAVLEARAKEPPVALTGMVASAEPLRYRQVRARGEWHAAGQVFIDNRIREGRAGFEVVTPLRLSGDGAALLVNRGWIARDAAYPRAPEVPVPGGEVEVSGLATLPPARVLELSADTIAGNVWQNLSIARYRERMGAKVLPVVVLAAQPAPGLAAVTEQPDAGVAKHVEYSLTWFSLAATTVVLWLVLSTKRVP